MDTWYGLALIYGLRRPRNPAQGVEFAGVVESVGKDVKTFKPGDTVFGMSTNHFGAHAEYLVLPEKEPLTVVSPAMSFEDAAGVCDGAPTALTFLRDQANVQNGQKVLINGASGAVGAYQRADFIRSLPLAVPAAYLLIYSRRSQPA